MEKAKEPFLAGDIILYIRDPKVSTRKLLELLNPSCKVARHKNASNIHTEEEIKETISFTSVHVTPMSLYPQNKP